MDSSVSLKRSVMSAVGWATATRFVAQLATWAMTLATVRFLSPADYGLMAVTISITSLLSSIGSIGFTDALVQNQRVTNIDLQSAFGLVLLINAGCLLILCALAYPAAWFYREPRLVALVQVASLMFVGIAFQSIPRALLDKRLDLKSVSRVDLFARITSGIMVLTFAWRGFGVWALLVGPLLAGVLRALGFSLAVGWFRPPRFNFRSLSEIMRFGGLRTVEQFLWYIYINADVFVIGRLLGADVVGMYFVSRNLAALPIDKFALTVSPAAFPAFSLVQRDRAGSLRYLRKAMRLLAFIAFPILFGVAATAPQVVAIALGPKWTGAVIPVAILSIAMTFRLVGLIIPPFLMGMGAFGASLRNTLFAVILFPTAFVVGSHWGLIGVCAAWLAAAPLQLLVLVRRAALVSGSAAVNLVSPLLSPLAGSLIMYLAVTRAAALLPADWHVWPSFLFLVAVGGLAYLAYAALFLRPLFAELRDLIRR